MVTDKQLISLLQIKVEGLERRINALEINLEKYYSIASCEFFFNGQSFKLHGLLNKMMEIMEDRYD